MGVLSRYTAKTETAACYLLCVSEKEEDEEEEGVRRESLEDRRRKSREEGWLVSKCFQNDSISKVEVKEENERA